MTDQLLYPQWNSTEKSREECGHSKSEQEQAETGEDQQAVNQQSTVLPGTSAKKGTKRKMSAKHKEESSPKKAAEHSDNPKPRKKIPIPPLPSKLPPVNLIHRDIVRAWCQQLKLSSKGQKLDAYRRLCEYAYPNQKMSGGVWSMGEVSLQTQMVGFTSSFMLDKPGFPKSREGE
ncbi:PREDICTED: developmental pluripotency-associated protein 4 [Propithecus coquereli]|uniref:developmental pluripotency-associated protein 4 n=1 Tax=Propithecus coquereli TaxID=379532 RepID=UPI00063EE687|nr:PREDICTED: developmental pluripotency-associated protein 4 [Propithecus coquereli]